MPKKESYWVARADKRMELAHKNSNKTIQEINSAYDKAIKDINEDIKNIFYNFAKSEGMDKGKAAELLSQRVSRKTITDIRARVNTVQDETIKRELINRLNAQAYNARITRLEALKESIYINSKQMSDAELSKSTSLYTKTIKDTYYRNIFDSQKALGYVYEFATMPNGTITEILKNNWSGKHYSSRIWDNSDVFASKLEDIITSGLMGGKSSARMAKDLAEYADVGKFVSERLIRTETTYVSTMADLEGSKTRGTEKLKFKATLDSKTSNVCREHDGNIVDVDKAVPGDNIPPLHCFCRSVMIDIIEGLEHKTRMARDPKTGKNYKVPADMTYEQWHKEHIANNPNAVTEEKKYHNRHGDKKQYEKYKEVLGAEMPKSLDDFQNLKYNDFDEWNKLQLSHKDQKIRNNIRSENTVKTIESGKQGKHVKGHNNYIKGRSYLTVTEQEAQELVNKYAGTGEIKRDNKGSWNNKEVVDFKKVIGVSIDNLTGAENTTTKAKIHYGKNGVHIVPHGKG